jgi:G3E family GTPase
MTPPPAARAGGPFAGAAAPLFGRRQKRPRGARLPVVVVTGFLGAGKTSLIRALLAKPEAKNTVVIVNEFGEVGIDDALLRASSDATVLLGNGCLCCEVRSDLDETLRALFIERAQGRVPSFERVVIETSGLADPGPVLQTFATDRALAGEFHLQSLIAVVDAPAGERNLARAPEARKQVALADRIVLSKTDMVDPTAGERLAQAIRALNPAPAAMALNGEVDPAFLLSDPAVERPLDPAEVSHAHMHGLDTFVLTFDEPLAWPALQQAMAALAALRGPDLLRVKGFVGLKECRGPVVLHYVQHVAHPPVELDAWPDGERRSRLVFITRNLPRAPVEQLFAALTAISTQ